VLHHLLGMPIHELQWPPLLVGFDRSILQFARLLFMPLHSPKSRSSTCRVAIFKTPILVQHKPNAHKYESNTTDYLMVVFVLVIRIAGCIKF
jgi:hypothetical protein